MIAIAGVYVVSELELRPNLLHSSFPFPFLAAAPLYAPVDPSELQRKSWPQFFQARSYALHTFHLFPIWPYHILLRFPLFTKCISMPPHEYVVSLVV